MERLVIKRVVLVRFNELAQIRGDRRGREIREAECPVDDPLQFLWIAVNELVQVIGLQCLVFLRGAQNLGKNVAGFAFLFHMLLHVGGGAPLLWLAVRQAFHRLLPRGFGPVAGLCAPENESSTTDRCIAVFLRSLLTCPGMREAAKERFFKHLTTEHGETPVRLDNPCAKNAACGMAGLRLPIKDVRWKNA